ncbi:MAG: Methylated-DNA--protein-cysteine methyltransferase [Pseudomonadota bacterium]|jgi:methylated-DNA-[protein]-cysteine S-methyltransferase
MKQFDLLYSAPFSLLGVTLTRGKVSGIDFLDDAQSLAAACEAPKKSKSAHKVKDELDRYFEDGLYPLDLSVELVGSPFQIKVWQTLRKIKPGNTVSYGMLARQLKSSARAIGGACRTNPVPIIVPCHRVISRQGLGGYTGDEEQRVDYKRYLLLHEKLKLVLG